MHVIKQTPLIEFWKKHPEAENPLKHWFLLAKAAVWKNINDLRKTFPHADTVQVGSGRNVVVFNIGGNKYRLVCAVHYNRGRIFLLRVMTHHEYGKGGWKTGL